MTHLVTAAAALLLALSSSPAITQNDDPSRAEVLASLGSDRVPADYVVLLDTSGSMLQDNRYTTAVPSLGGLFEALSAEDHVALYTFDSAPNLEYQGPSRSAPELLGKLPPAPNPGGATDLGKAMAAALQELRRDGAAPVANVVVITDGAHDAAPGSPYADSTGPEWDALRQQAAREVGPELSVYAVPLGDGSSGAAAVKSVFDGTIVLTPGDVQNLGEYLGRSKARMEMEKARTVLAGDIGTSLEARWEVEPDSDGNAEFVVTLTSTAEHVPLDVSNVRLDADAMTMIVTASPQAYRIDPGESVDVTGSVSFRPEDDGLLLRTATEETTVGLHATVKSGWTTALQPEIDLAVDRELTSRSTSVTLSRTIGSSMLLPTAALVVLVLAAALMFALLFLRRRRQDVLSGTLVVSSGVESTELARFALTGRKTVLDGLPGQGWVTPGGFRSKHGDLKISYTNTPGTRPPVTGSCASGRSLILGGLFFSHHKNGD